MTTLAPSAKVCTKCETEKPLEDFHASPAHKYGRRAWCKVCFTAKADAWTRANRRRVSDGARRRRQQDAGQRKRDRDIKLRHRYGITLERYEEMLAEQGNACAVCGYSPSEDGRALDVDHCHETGRIRALLCRACNHALGRADDDPERLRALARYVEHHRWRR